MNKPGSIVYLPYEWPVTAHKLNAHPATPPPISKYLMKHPWQLSNLFSRQVPGEKSIRGDTRSREDHINV
jgi:hypothetical protein